MRGAPPSLQGGRRAGAAGAGSRRVGVAVRAGPTGREGEGRAAGGGGADPTAATYAGTSELPKLIVNGLTNAINAVLGPAADVGDWEAPEEGPAVTPAELKEGLRQDYEDRNYLVSGAGESLRAGGRRSRRLTTATVAAPPRSSRASSTRRCTRGGAST